MSIIGYRWSFLNPSIIESILVSSILLHALKYEKSNSSTEWDLISLPFSVANLNLQALCFQYREKISQTLIYGKVMFQYLN